MEVRTRFAKIELPFFLSFRLPKINLDTICIGKKTNKKLFNRHLSGLGTHSQEEMTNKMMNKMMISHI